MFEHPSLNQFFHALHCRVTNFGNLSFYLVELQTLTTSYFSLQSYKIWKHFILPYIVTYYGKPFSFHLALQSYRLWKPFFLPHRVTDSGKHSCLLHYRVIDYDNFLFCLIELQTLETFHLTLQRYRLWKPLFLPCRVTDSNKALFWKLFIMPCRVTDSANIFSFNLPCRVTDSEKPIFFHFCLVQLHTLEISYILALFIL